MPIDEPSLPPELPSEPIQPPAAESAAPAAEPFQEASPPPSPPPLIVVQEASPPPPPIIVQEVEAVPISKSEPAQRTIDAPPIIEPVRSAPVPPIPPPPVSPTEPPPPSAGATATSSIPPLSSSPPPSSIPPPPPPAPPRDSAWRRRKQFIWSILCHLLLILVIPTVFVGMAATFLIWQLKGKKDQLVEDQGREALNFQINVAALTALLGITCLGAPLIPMVWFVAVIMAIVAARHASDGETYRYPWVLRIVTH